MISRKTKDDLQEVLKKWAEDHEISHNGMIELLEALSKVHGTTALREVFGTLYTDWLYQD